MKNKILKIGILLLFLVLVLIVIIVIVKSNIKSVGNEIEPSNTVEIIEEPLVVLLDKSEETEDEEDDEIHIKDASELTQEIYDINGQIGVLKIPKTGLNTQIYSRVDANKMETMPCFLYTTGGLNEVGNTIFVGHNRANGLLFSDNKMLEENDEFYFTDINGVEKKYVVYSKFVTSNDDISFYNIQVDSPVIVMQCCLTPTDEEQVLIVMAKAD